MVQLCLLINIRTININMITIRFNDRVKIKDIILIDDISMMIINSNSIQLNINLNQIILLAQPDYFLLKRMPNSIIELFILIDIKEVRTLNAFNFFFPFQLHVITQQTLHIHLIQHYLFHNLLIVIIYTVSFVALELF